MIKIFELKSLNILCDERNAARLELVKAENQLMRNSIAHMELHRIAEKARRKIDSCNKALEATARRERQERERWE